MTPILSIIIPAYNASEFLALTLDSMVAQTLAAIEVIVIDDGSTDNTRAVADQYVRSGKVKVFTQQNSGLPAARNAGLDYAQGHYVSFLDADDLWHPRKAELQCELLDAHPGLDMTWSGWCIIDEVGRYTGRSRPNYKGKSDLSTLIQSNFIGPGHPVIRREAVEAAGRFDSTMTKGCEDWDLWLRIAGLREGNMAYVPGALVAYRRHTSQMSKNWQNMEAAWRYMFNKALALWPECVEPVERLAHARFKTYLAYLNMETSDFGTAADLLLQAWRHAPSVVTKDKTFLRVAAVTAVSTVLPKTWGETLRDRAPLVLFSRRTVPVPLEWDREGAGLRT